MRKANAIILSLSIVRGASHHHWCFGGDSKVGKEWENFYEDGEREVSVPDQRLVAGSS